MSTHFEQILQESSYVRVQQRHEILELFGVETRNKYDVYGSAGELIGHASEKSTGLWGAVTRYLLGHWRTFEVNVFDVSRNVVLTAEHPFRFFFQRFEVYDFNGRVIGALQQRFSIFSKDFDVEDASGYPIMKIRSPLWKFWTFPVLRRGVEVATILKKWSGLLFEGFTDKDNFMIEYSASDLSAKDRKLLLAAAIFVDIQYFERRASRD